MILIIDNYDSFSYNLVQSVGEINSDLIVLRSDEIDVSKLQNLNIKHIIISPGPGHPDEYTICKQVVKFFAPYTPILGICLGHQIIATCYNASIKKSSPVFHGRASKIYCLKDKLFLGIHAPFTAARYHSLVVDQDKRGLDLTTCLKTIAITREGVIMACKHRYYHFTYGIQFHPESMLTIQGTKLLKNFLSLSYG
uniref:Anthranilate synthase component 2 n=1 Tax=Cyanidium caldarium TaxID=2771 RepID=TRPG_CYACA|nr:anthranilate synthase component 2 [Cyanidium caldarium]O19914.1 RecName: Full=Anthranilate synthase component 2; Short=AS; AltName: Full=Anthranilate synthase, glutamine amidotransferase component [Cyanidium caldarium]AAB82675.1 unknown [Cyanidium caldarium]WDB00213.1 anthranilate synthase component 2 [Cyanidium caldarium]